MLTEHPLEQAEPFEWCLKIHICSLEQSKSYTLLGPFRTVESISLERRAIMRIVWDTFVINSFFLFRCSICGSIWATNLYLSNVYYVSILTLSTPPAFAGPYKQTGGILPL